MPVTTRDPSSPSKLKRFRDTLEGFLMRVHQRELLRKYSPEHGERASSTKGGLAYKLLSLFFLPFFRLTSWPFKRRMLRLFFVYEEQQWPERPWKEEQNDG